MRHGHHKADEAKRECDGTHLARSASATVHTLHAKWDKVAMCGERTQVIFVFVLPLDQTVRVCVLILLLLLRRLLLLPRLLLLARAVCDF